MIELGGFLLPKLAKNETGDAIVSRTIRRHAGGRRSVQLLTKLWGIWRLHRLKLDKAKRLSLLLSHLELRLDHLVRTLCRAEASVALLREVWVLLLYLDPDVSVLLK